VTALQTVDGVRLEARWDRPDRPTLAVVFCHPHPLHGGTMTAPLMDAVTRRLVTRGCAVLRFNFRGTAGSEGAHGAGETEIADVAAAVDAARVAEPALPLGLCGWSFGAVVALAWEARTRATLPYVGIAPPMDRGLVPVLPTPESLLPARRSFIVGDRDQFVPVTDLAEYAARLDADLHVLPGSDHFFWFREAQVADLVHRGLER